MKNLISLILISLLCQNLEAQSDTTQVKVIRKNIVTVIEDNDSTHVKVGDDQGIEVVTDHEGDTTKIRIGRRTFQVIDDDSGTSLK